MATSGYGVQTNLPWMASQRAASSSSISPDFDSDAPEAPRPLQILKPHTSHAAAATDQPASQLLPPARDAPRQSRLPVFKHVQKMLASKRTSAAPTANDATTTRWDPWNGEPSDTGRPGQVRPSKYKSPTPPSAYDFEVRRRSLVRQQSPAGAGSARHHSRSVSPVSMLRPGEFDCEYRPSFDVSAHDPRPVSPLSIAQHQRQEQRAQRLSWEAGSPPQALQYPLPETPISLAKMPKRKPVSSIITTSPDLSSHSRTSSQDTSHAVEAFKGLNDEFERRPIGYKLDSHFSWTTYAPSVLPSDHQIADSPDLDKGDGHPSDDMHIRSRFSWSTVATNQVQQADSMPPSPTPPVPAKYQRTPVESILARHRPVPSAESARRNGSEPAQFHPPRISSHPAYRKQLPSMSPVATSTNSAYSNAGLPVLRTRFNRTTDDSVARAETSTPTSNVASTPVSANTLNSKRLPPPPIPGSPLSHLDALLRAQQDKAHQRKNIERGIARQESRLVSSPLDVPFAEVREAKRQLKELRDTLDEVLLEEREIGIAISRARRKEGEDEGLWVRRVTN